MPINKKYPIEELIKAAKYFSEKRNRKVLLEYIMLEGINDSKEQAEKLAELIGDSRLFVNLIPYNPSREDDFRRSNEESIRAFYDVLKKNNIGVTRRREFGSDLDAACGQLRSDRIKKEEV
jgi:23S rRNA (adenine2503-C2)-methyltransferase